MSFGQALFFGVGRLWRRAARRATSISPVFWCCRGHADRPHLSRCCSAASCCWAGIPPTSIFVALGTLTGSYAAERLARGWHYVGGQNGLPSIKPMTLGSYEFVEGPVVLLPRARHPRSWSICCCRFLVRSQFGLALAGMRQNEQRIAFFGYRVQHLKALVFALGGTVAGLAGASTASTRASSGPTWLGVVSRRRSCSTACSAAPAR